jgi:hypothetical protein
MSDPSVPDDAPISPEEMRAALFAHMVMQQSSMAMMMLGKTPHPETGKTVCDLEAAKYFIDLLEMLEAKTKGNLDAQETAMLKQSLMSLRMAYVEAVESPASPAEPPREAAPAPAGAASATGAAPAAAPEDEGKKKFTKKY